MLLFGPRPSKKFFFKKLSLLKQMRTKQADISLRKAPMTKPTITRTRKGTKQRNKEEKLMGHQLASPSSLLFWLKYPPTHSEINDNSFFYHALPMIEPTTNT